MKKRNLVLILVGIFGGSFLFAENFNLIIRRPDGSIYRIPNVPAGTTGIPLNPGDVQVGSEMAASGSGMMPDAFPGSSQSSGGSGSYSGSSASAQKYSGCDMASDDMSSGGLRCKLSGSRVSTVWTGSVSKKEVEDGKSCEDKLSDKRREDFDSRYDSCDFDTADARSGGQSCKYNCTAKNPSVIWSGSVSKRQVEDGKDCDDVEPKSMKIACGDE